MRNFRNLHVRRKSHELTLEVYQITRGFPREELYGLTSQIRRSCSSIAANIAEGCGKKGDAERARFCFVALGSASELEYHLLLATDLEFIKSNDFDRLDQSVTEVKRMLAGLILTLKAEG
jgi:four helix bundle protein